MKRMFDKPAGSSDKKTHDYLILVTPTYKQPSGWRTEFFEERIRQLESVEQDCFWVICEDEKEVDPVIQDMLEKSKIVYAYIAHGPTKDKGNEQRNACYEYIVNNRLYGLVYNMDDDNAVDIRLFGALMETEKNKVGVFSIGNIWGPGPGGKEMPIVRSGKVHGWYAWDRHRTYPIDMGTFCFDASFLYKKREDGKKLWNFSGRGGENEFLTSILDGSYQELQPIMNNCNEVYAWHNELLYRKMGPHEHARKSETRVQELEQIRLNMNINMDEVRSGQHMKKIKTHKSAGTKRTGKLPPEADVGGLWP